MASGQTVLKKIKTKISELETEEDKFNKELIYNENKIENNNQALESAYTRLAVTYLPALDAETVAETLKEKQRQVQRIYEGQQRRREDVEGSMKENRTQRSTLEEELDVITGKMEEMAKLLSGKKELVKRRLDENPAYKESSKNAKERRSELGDDQKRFEAFQSLIPGQISTYKDNEVFMYLLAQGYGTSHYKTNAVTRALDDKVASLFDFEKAKRNFEFLELLPDAMKERIAEQQKKLGNVEVQLRGLEDDAKKACGFYDVESDAKKVDQKRNALLAKLGSNDKTYEAYVAEMKELASKKGKYHQEAIDELKSYLQGNSLTELKRRAKETPSPEDDKLVDRIEVLTHEIETLKANAKETKKNRGTVAERLTELRTIETRYRQKDYESNRSEFRSGFNADSLLMGFMLGQVSSTDFNRSLDQHHYFEQPSYDSSSSYSQPSSSSSDSYSSGGGYDSGGFSGGGGFDGGGGFSSGGGF